MCKSYKTGSDTGSVTLTRDLTQPIDPWPEDPVQTLLQLLWLWRLVVSKTDSQWSPSLHRLQCSLARIHLQSPVLQSVLHAQCSTDSSLQLLAAWSTVVAIVNHSPPTVARIHKQTRTPNMASLIWWALASEHHVLVECFQCSTFLCEQLLKSVVHRPTDACSVIYINTTQQNTQLQQDGFLTVQVNTFITWGKLLHVKPRQTFWTVLQRMTYHIL